MKLSKLFTTSLITLCLAVPMSLAACDDTSDDEGDTAANDEADDETSADEGAMDIECSTFCVSFVEMCIQSGESTEFETDEECNAACPDWDQAGVNCRHEQIVAGECGEAGNMGSTCS